MGKKALVVSGGGSKGAFAVGVIKALFQTYPNLDFDIFVGTSTGSLIVPMAAAGNIALLEQLYTTLHTDDVVRGGNMAKRFVGDISLFDVTPLLELINKTYDAALAKQILDSDKSLYITTTCLQTSESVIYSNKPPLPNSDYHIEQMKDETIFRRAVLASACQPVFMQPIQIDQTANPVRQYVDGGVKTYLGIQVAIDAGADEIMAISLAALGIPDERNFTKAVDILFKTIEIFTQNVGVNDVKFPTLYNSALQYIDAVKTNMLAAGIAQSKIDAFFNIPNQDRFVNKKPLLIYHVFPDVPLGGGSGGLTFDPDEMKGMIAKGEQSLQQLVASLPPGTSLFA